NGGFLFIILKPPSQRTETAFDVINVLRPQLMKDTVAQAFPNAQQDLRIGGRGSPALYQYTLEADSNKQLLEWGPKLQEAMKKLPGFEDVNSDQQTGGLDAYLTYDRVNAAKLGFTVQSLDSALYSAFGQEQVSIIYTPLNQYYSVLEVAPQYFQSPSNLNDTYLISSGKSAIPIFTVSSKQANTIPLAVNHTGLFPSITLSFNLAPGLSLSDAEKSINGMMHDPDLNVPTSIHGGLSGMALAYQDTWKTLPWLILTALAAIYIVLGVLYENVVHPITIMSTLVSASAGAMLGMWIYNLFNPKATNLMELDLISVIGIILLIGIVKKNAIMMIDFALQAEKNVGKGPADSIFEACMLRFRPIMMTTMAALFGALPLAFGTGTGSELRKPLGISIVGGLIVSQLLTLYTTPVVYLTFDRFRLWIKGKKPDVFHHGEEPLPSDA
ncbi:MAG TPA: efflux RND transporter permease subunit, partial [Chthoniobacteraceae bacterium]|nr:efflux RND transporter permease subunit [Chthoniobacteraceae bacterium]